LCGWEDDDFGRRFPDEVSAANHGYRLTESRKLFEEHLTLLDASDARGWTEYAPGIRQLKRMIISTFLAALEHRDAASILLALGMKGKGALASARHSLELQFLDTSHETSFGEPEDDLDLRSLDTSIRSLLRAVAPSKHRSLEVQGYLEASDYRLAIKTIVYEMIRKRRVPSATELSMVDTVLASLPGGPDRSLRDVVARELKSKASS
jgi:hypothetical protein